MTRARNLGRLANTNTLTADNTNNFVGIGRPAIYGLICDGHRGVSSIFEILKSEMITAMKNGGFNSIKDFKFNRLIFDEK